MDAKHGKGLARLVKNFLEYDGQRGASTISSSFIKSGTNSMRSLIGAGHDQDSGFIYTSPMESEDILAILGSDNSVANVPKDVHPSYSRTIYLKDLQKIAQPNDAYNEVAFYRRHRNHLKSTKGRKDRKNMPDFYMGNTGDPEIVELLKKYNIPVLHVNMEKYPYISQEQQVENTKTEEIER